MKQLLSSAAVVLLTACGASSARADEVTLLAPAGMRCAIEKMTPGFEQKTGHKLKTTTGAGGATHQQVVRGERFDVPIVQPPYQDVLASGHVVTATETRLATIPVVVIVRKSDPKPDISTPDAVRRLLLAAKGISYPDPAGGLGGAAGVSVDATQKKLGIFEQMQPKVKRVQGVGLLQLLARGDIDVALTFPSEINEPSVQVVGPLPLEISTPTGLVGFVSTDTKVPAAARAVLSYFSSADAAASYRACGMQPAR